MKNFSVCQEGYNKTGKIFMRKISPVLQFSGQCTCHNLSMTDQVRVRWRGYEFLPQAIAQLQSKLNEPGRM